MSGYGSVDDEAERASIRVEEQVAITRARLPKGPGSSTCLECGEPIPDGRRKALPGVVYCIGCQDNHDIKFTAKVPWAT